MVAIIDYDAGNIKSVEKAIAFLGKEAVITRDSSIILNADHVILPGVGNFGDAMEKLNSFQLLPVIKEAIEEKIPFLGICLGLQLLFERSEECPGVEGLGILKGEIRRFPNIESLKIPHIGWNSLELRNKGRIFQGLEDNSYVYFVHSYYLEAAEEKIVTTTTEYGVSFHSSIEKGNVFACQFHPEKSSDTGLKILENFLKLKREDM
ncbi:MAG: imidazole glycerol phosphate synthase subunit HisH [Lachnospiraceae bacterium]